MVRFSMVEENINKDGYFVMKNLFLKIMAVIIFIQGILQLLNVVVVLSGGMSGVKISMALFYLSVALTLAYGISAVFGGYYGLRYNKNYNGCKIAFYFGVALLILNFIMLIMNITMEAFHANQIVSFVVPGLFTAAAVFGGRACKNL